MQQLLGHILKHGINLFPRSDIIWPNSNTFFGTNNCFWVKEYFTIFNNSQYFYDKLN